MHFRILEMIATSGFLTALECTKFFFGRRRAYSERKWRRGREGSTVQTPRPSIHA